MSTSDVIVVTGVAGSGKTSVARAIAAETGWDFVEGESFLTKAQRKAFSEGRLSAAETDAWLAAVGEWIDQYERTGRDAVVACAALTHHQRDVLRQGRPHVRFCHVTADDAVLRERVGAAGAAHLTADEAAVEPLVRGEHGVTVSTEGDEWVTARRAFAALGMDPGHS